MGYIGMLRQAPRRLTLGFSLNFFAAFGQTYFIALSGGALRAQFELGAGAFGGVYSLATLLSGGLLVFTGPWIDRVDLRVYLSTVVAGFALAAAALGLVETRSAVFLFFILLGLRLFGQGLMTHASSTTMARDFTADRGKALSFASLGHAAAEAVFPLLAVALFAAIGWRATWTGAGVLLAAGVLPALLWLATTRRRPGPGERAAPIPEADPRAGAGDGGRHWTRGEVLRDPVFHILLPVLLAAPFINTGIFFHQIPLIEERGWPLALFAAGFTVYAASTVIGTLVGGRLVDRLTAVGVIRWARLPLAASLLILYAIDHPAAIFGYMALGGLGQGLFYSLTTALYAEMYGLRHLGAIRALATALMVLATGLSPALFGWLLDAGRTMTGIVGVCALFALAGIPLSVLAMRLRRRRAESVSDA